MKVGLGNVILTSEVGETQWKRTSNEPLLLEYTVELHIYYHFLLFYPPRIENEEGIQGWNTFCFSFCFILYFRYWRRKKEGKTKSVYVSTHIWASKEPQYSYIQCIMVAIDCEHDFAFVLRSAIERFVNPFGKQDKKKTLHKINFECSLHSFGPLIIPVITVSAHSSSSSFPLSLPPPCYLLASLFISHPYMHEFFFSLLTSQHIYVCIVSPILDDCYIICVYISTWMLLQIGMYEFVHTFKLLHYHLRHRHTYNIQLFRLLILSYRTTHYSSDDDCNFHVFLYTFTVPGISKLLFSLSFFEIGRGSPFL